MKTSGEAPPPAPNNEVVQGPFDGDTSSLSEAPPLLGAGGAKIGDSRDTSPQPSKSERTRERILASSLELFTEKGYAQTTMRDIADRSGSSLGLAYRYFARKEELVIALYERLAGELAEEVASLPREPLAARFAQAIRLDIARLAPHRDAFGALFSVGLDLDSDVAVLGERVAPIRARVWDIFRDVVAGSSDAPRRQSEINDLATVFYATHLAYVLFWLQDRTPNQTATTALLAWAEETLARLRPFLRLPLAARSLARLSVILTPMFREKQEGQKVRT